MLSCREDKITEKSKQLMVFLPSFSLRLHLLLSIFCILCLVPRTTALTYYVGSSSAAKGDGTPERNEPLTRDEKMTILAFCKGAIASRQRTKIINPDEFRAVCKKLTRQLTAELGYETIKGRMRRMF